MQAVIRQLVSALDQSDTLKPTEIRFDGEQVVFGFTGSAPHTEECQDVESFFLKKAQRAAPKG